MSKQVESPKSDLIEELAELAFPKSKMPKIQEVFEFEGKDGNWYSLNGMPFGMQTTGSKRSIGFSWQNKDGVGTFGSRKKTAEELVRHWEENNEKRKEEFKKNLAAMSNKELKEQEEYWRSATYFMARLKQGHSNVFERFYVKPLAKFDVHGNEFFVHRNPDKSKNAPRLLVTNRQTGQGVAIPRELLAKNSEELAIAMKKKIEDSYLYSDKRREEFKNIIIPKFLNMLED